MNNQKHWHSHRVKGNVTVRLTPKSMAHAGKWCARIGGSYYFASTRSGVLWRAIFAPEKTE